MLRRCIAIALILCVLLQVTSRMWIVVAFRVNQDYIAAYLCKNRFRPELQCNGNCVLMQRLREAEREDAQAAPQVAASRPEAPFLCPPQLEHPAPLLPLAAGVRPDTGPLCCPGPWMLDIFWPPELLRCAG
ncbi:MAG: hypothetical protein NW241_01115 [Bacteroidia bacterium]|nr:hypothetical protein [Bacteroidia bacterium]